MTARRTNSWFTGGRSSWISRWPWILTIGLLPALRCRSEAFRFAHSVKSCWRSMSRSYQARRGLRPPSETSPQDAVRAAGRPRAGPRASEASIRRLRRRSRRSNLDHGAFLRRALELDAGPQLDDAVGRDAEEVGQRAGVARHEAEQALSPPHHRRRARRHDPHAAEVVGRVLLGRLEAVIAAARDELP